MTVGQHRPRPLTTRPSVSVVIPCYNYGRFLPCAVASALDQHGVDVDVLIVDDASTDGSADIARDLASTDPRVDVLVHAQNTGHIRTYNDGLARVRGDYVALLSADDLLTTDSLARAATLMEHHPSVGLVYGYARSFSGGADALAQGVRSWSIHAGRRWLRLAARRGRCFLSSPEAVMRRTALEQTDLYDARLPHSADFDMWLRTAARWDVGRVNGPVQALYRVHDANMHLTTYAGWAADLAARRRTFEILFEERAPDLPEVQRLRPVAFRALSREAARRARLAQHDGDLGAAAAYLDFAAATDPDRRPRVPPVPARLDRFADRLTHHLRWRRERRYGT
jgi:glycosyltransferase involved in cell wall biosynthesis